MDKKVQWNLAAAVWVLVLGLLFLGYMGLGGLKKGKTEEASGAPPLAKTSCPIDKHEVEITDATPRVIYQGVQYVFCEHRDEKGKDHKMLFLMDPDLYLTGKSGLGSAPATAVPAARP